MRTDARIGTRLAGALLAASCCAGCSSFQGRPALTMPTRSTVAAARGYDLKTAMAEWNAAAGNEPVRRTIRDKFVTLRVDAADALYAQFLVNVSVESKGGGFGLDLIGLGLSGGGAVAGQATANALSAAAVGVSGARTAFNKDAFFEKALPAVIAEMGAARTRALANIRAGLHQNADTYLLADAVIDVNAYENAASLDGGIQELSKNAAADAQAQATAFKAEFDACLPGTDTFVPRVRLKTFLNGLAASDPDGTLDKMLSALGLTPAVDATPAAKEGQIIDYTAQKLCTYAAMKAAFASWDPADFR
jgi:hypothetical protein